MTSGELLKYRNVLLMTRSYTASGDPKKCSDGVDGARTGIWLNEELC